MESVKGVIESVVLDPKYAGLLAIVKATRNGAVYGTKIRFPHALVMTFLFRSGSFKEKVGLVLKATRTHAQNLASFVFIYKSIMYILRNMPRGSDSAAKQLSSDSFIAGLIGGYIIFGRGNQSSVNQQIVIYLFARVTLALAKMSVQSGALISTKTRDQLTSNAWPVFASLSWAGVMWLYYNRPDTLQPSLRSSMKYIYTNADHWSDLRTFIWHNQ